MAKLGLESRFAVWFTGLFCQSPDELWKTCICLMEESLFMQLQGSKCPCPGAACFAIKTGKESVTESVSIFLNSSSNS